MPHGIIYRNVKILDTKCIFFLISYSFWQEIIKLLKTQFIGDTQYNNAGFQKGFYENLAESPISISLTHIMLHTFPLTKSVMTFLSNNSITLYSEVKNIKKE